MNQEREKFDKLGFSEVIDHIKEPILILSREGKILAINKELLRRTGFTRDEAISKNFVDFIHPDHKEYVISRFLERIGNINSESQEFFSMIIDKNSRVHNLLISSNQIIDNGEIIGLWINLKISNVSGKFSEFFMRVQEISQNIAGTLDITELLTKICESIGRILDFPLVYVSLIHPEDKELYPVAWNGNTKYFLKYENFVNLHNEDEIPEYFVLRNNKILIVNSIRKDSDEYGSWKEILSEENYHSYIGFPIRLGNTTEGILNIFSQKEFCFGDVEQVDSLKTLTNFITVAIKNSRLFNKIIQAEERYRGLFYESPNGLCLINKELQIHEINPKFLKFIGFSVKDFHVLTDFKKILSKKDYKRFYDIFNQSAAEKLSNSFESMIEKSDGEMRWIHFTISPLLDKFKNILEYLIITRDVTDEKFAELAILDSEKKFRDLFENSSDVIFQIDKSGKLEKVNDAFETITGWKKKNWIGKSFLKLFPKETWKDFLHNISEIISGKTLSWESLIQVRDKEEKSILISVWPTRNVEGEIVGLWGSFKDITEIKNTHHKLAQTNIELEKINIQLEELNNTKTEFLESISHELKTPLVPVFGYLSLLKDKSFGELTKDGYEAVDNSLKNLTRLKNVIGELIQIAEYQKSTPVINLQVVDLKDFLFPVILNYVPLFKEKKIDFKYDSIPEETIFLRIDSEKMSEVFHQLLNNSLKFTNSGSVEILVDKHENQVTFTVKDTGIGIPEKELKHVFDRFYQVDKGTRRKYLGIGVGLSIVKEVLLSHGVNISVKSKLNSGTEFQFTLPIAREDTE
mgnify:CR=1 FL=1